MHGRRSCRPELWSLDLELERTLRRLRASARVPKLEYSYSYIEPLKMADPNVPNVPNRTLKDYFTPTAYISPSCIQLPNTTAAHYEIKSSTIQMLPPFHGLTHDDPYKHLNEFLEICSTVRIQNFTNEALMLRLFPFSLKDKAKHWLNSLPANSITTWDQLQQRFLEKYFPIGKTNQLKRPITNFAQMDGEQFYETLERLRDLLQQCPHHQVPDWQLVQTFYYGLTEPHRQMVDSSCGGTFMSKNDAEAWQLFENLSDNSLHHASAARQVRQPVVEAPKRGGIYEVGQNLELADRKSVV